jgi:hypothetical protein
MPAIEKSEPVFVQHRTPSSWEANKAEEQGRWNEYHDPEIVDYKRVRKAIEHENELTHHRLSWLLTTQTILGAAFGLIVHDIDSKNIYKGILIVLSLIGILTSAFIRNYLIAAEDHHEELRAWWRNRVRTAAHPPITGRHSVRVHASRVATIFGVAWFLAAVFVLINTLSVRVTAGIGIFATIVVVLLVAFGQYRSYLKTRYAKEGALRRERETRLRRLILNLLRDRPHHSSELMDICMSARYNNEEWLAEEISDAMAALVAEGTAEQRADMLTLPRATKPV